MHDQCLRAETGVSHTWTTYRFTWSAISREINIGRRPVAHHPERVSVRACYTCSYIYIYRRARQCNRQLRWQLGLAPPPGPIKAANHSAQGAASHVPPLQYGFKMLGSSFHLRWGVTFHLSVLSVCLRRFVCIPRYVSPPSTSRAPTCNEAV